MDKQKEKKPMPKLHKYTGILELYYETGMEGMMGVQFHDDRGNHEGPKWDKPEETMIYRSLEWALRFGNRMCFYNIRIFDKENNVVYEGSLTQDRKKMKTADLRFSFLPKEIDKRTWIKYCQEEYKGEVFTNELVYALEQEYKPDFKVGEVVHDDLTGKDAILLHITRDDNKNLGYWIKGDEGYEGRLPWELTRIDYRAMFDKRMKEAEEAEKNKK